jgi:hypothetical protein
MAKHKASRSRKPPKSEGQVSEQYLYGPPGSAAIIRGEHDEIQIEPGPESSQRVIKNIDEVLRWSGVYVEADPEIRGQLSAARSAELLRIAQQPELPPDGEDPAA